MQGAGFYRARVGAVTVTLVSDGGFPMDPAALFGEVPAAEIAAAKRDAFLRDEPYPGHLNALVVQDGSNTILVDTGGGAFAPTTGKLLRNLARAGIAPGDVTHVVLTHGHPDHIGGLLDANGKSTFAKARISITEAEHAYWTGDPANQPGSKLPADAIRGMAAGATKAFAAIKEQLEMLRPEQAIGSAVTVLDAAGHTPGHVALRIDSNDDSLLYVTDAVHLAPLQFAHPEWQILYDADRDQAAETRRRLLDMAVADRLRVAGAHIAFPAFGFVEKADAGYRWVPDVWQW